MLDREKSGLKPFSGTNSELRLVSPVGADEVRHLPSVPAAGVHRRDWDVQVSRVSIAQETSAMVEGTERTPRDVTLLSAVRTINEIIIWHTFIAL